MMNKLKKKGFTLIELVVVIVIISIIAGAIYTVMQMSIVTFSNSSKRMAAQSVSRLALNDMKKYLGVLNYIEMSPEPPNIMPATGGHIYFDATASQFIVKEPSGSQREYAIDADLASEVMLYFDLVEPTDEMSDYNSLRITVRIDSFILTTDVFLQNLEETKNKIILTDPTHRTSQFIYFE